MSVTPIRFYSVGENPHSKAVLDRPLEDFLTGSGYLADGSDFEGFLPLRTPITLGGDGAGGIALDVLTLSYDTTHTAAMRVTSLGGLVTATGSLQPFAVTTFVATAYAVLAAQTRVGDLFRVESTAVPDVTGLTGGGVEIKYTPASFGIIRSYDYTAAALQVLVLSASQVNISATTGLHVLTGGVTSSAGSNVFVDDTQFQQTITIQNHLNSVNAGTIRHNNGPMQFDTVWPASPSTAGYYFSIATTLAMEILANGVRFPGGATVSLKATGAAATAGSGALVAGTKTFATTAATATCQVKPTRKVAAGTIGDLTYTINPGVSLTITSSSAIDTSTVDWIIVETN